MSAEADPDIWQGVVTAWAAASTLNAALPHARVTADDAGSLALPYARLSCSAGPGTAYSQPATSGSAYLLGRTLLVEVFGYGPPPTGSWPLRTVLPLVRTLLEPGFAMPTGTGSVLSVYPDDDRGELARVKGLTKDGQDVWRAALPFRLLLQRTIP